jgi:hypothetical protein
MVDQQKLAKMAAFILAATLSLFSILSVTHYGAYAQTTASSDSQGSDTGKTSSLFRSSNAELRLVVLVLDSVDRLESQGYFNETEVSTPTTVLIPINVEGQTAQICILLLSSGDMTCQQVIINSDTVAMTLSTNSAASDGDKGQTVDDTSKNVVFVLRFLHEAARLDSQGELNVTSINIPITIIVPIDVDSETAQICLSILSSGDLTCEQIIIDVSDQTISTNQAEMNSTMISNITSTGNNVNEADDEATDQYSAEGETSNSSISAEDSLIASENDTNSTDTA